MSAVWLSLESMTLVSVNVQKGQRMGGHGLPELPSLIKRNDAVRCCFKNYEYNGKAWQSALTSALILLSFWASPRAFST